MKRDGNKLFLTETDLYRILRNFYKSELPKDKIKHIMAMRRKGVSSLPEFMVIITFEEKEINK